MASEVTVSFKAYLRQNGLQDNPEVRRFGIDSDVVSSFTYMREKLQAVFPSLKGKRFTVSWKDADGDDVVISSDEELMIALAEGKSDVYKLYVDVKGDLKDAPEAMHVEETSAGDELHVGVECDGCSGPVEGFRYKCAMCHDYDLCSGCEAKGVHSEHIMLRLPAPITWNPHFKHHLVHKLAKSMRKFEGKRDEDGHRRWRGKHGHERHCSPDEQSHGKHGHDRRCSPEEHGPRESAGQSGRQHGGCPMRGHGGRHSFMDFLSSYMGENMPKDSMESKEYLKTIGRTVAQFLDPLGIAVNVEVRTDDDAQSSKQAEAEKEKEKEAGKEKQNQKAPGERQQKVHFAADGGSAPAASAPEASCENVEMMDESSQPPRVQEADPELEHWTVVNDAGSSTPTQEPSVEMASAPPSSQASAAQSQASATFSTTAPQSAAFSATAPQSAASSAAAAASSAESAAAMAAAAAAEMYRQARAAFTYAGNTGGFAVPPGTLYPNLPPQPQAQQPAPTPATTQADTARTPAPAHPDPRIAEAVTMMMSMGFSNDGGWLTQLLASKNGDISQALDVLQPVKRA